MTKSSKLFITNLVGALVLVSGFTASPGAQKYSDWSQPVNLGPLVNSTSMDRGPAISKDGLSLYFASNRLGFGGEDIYVSQRETRDSEWGPAVNLGPTINTSFSEMVPAFSRDGHLLFLASNRIEGSFGGVDIWVSRREDTHDFTLPSLHGADAATQIRGDFLPGVEPLFERRALFWRGLVLRPVRHEAASLAQTRQNAPRSR